MPRSREYLFALVVTLPALAGACSTADQDRADRRRTLAAQACEGGVREQLSSGAAAQFSNDSVHVYYDSAGGAAVSGTVATPSGQRSFACVLSSASDSTWTVSEARLLN
ncbi:MAG TPA: hypothetical protein VII66_02445 [Gemmatimonadaceae bacterium]